MIHIIQLLTWNVLVLPYVCLCECASQWIAPRTVHTSLFNWCLESKKSTCIYFFDFMNFQFQTSKNKNNTRRMNENKRLQRFFHFTIILNFVWNSTKISNILKFKPSASLLTQRQFATSVVSIFMRILIFSTRNRFVQHWLNVSILQSTLIKFRSIYNTILCKFKRKFFTYLNWVIQLGDSHVFLFTHIEWLASY